MAEQLDPDIMNAIVAEFRRIGLAMHEMPGVVMEAGAEATLLEELKRFPVGSSWAAVFPNAPAPVAYSGERQESAEPIAPFDELAPEGSAIIAFFDPHVLDEAWAAAVDELRARGFPVHSAGLILRRPEFLKAGLVLRITGARDAARATLQGVVKVLYDQPGIWNLSIRRFGFDYYGRSEAPRPTPEKHRPE